MSSKGIFMVYFLNRDWDFGVTFKLFPNLGIYLILPFIEIRTGIVLYNRCVHVPDSTDTSMCGYCGDTID